MGKKDFNKFYTNRSNTVVCVNKESFNGTWDLPIKELNPNEAFNIIFDENFKRKENVFCLSGVMDNLIAERHQNDKYFFASVCAQYATSLHKHYFYLCNNSPSFANLWSDEKPLVRRMAVSFIDDVNNYSTLDLAGFYNSFLFSKNERQIRVDFLKYCLKRYGTI